MKNNEAPQPIYLKDYEAPKYKIDTIDLTFDLHDTATKVKSVMSIRRVDGDASTPLALNGEELVLNKVLLNGEDFTNFEEKDDMLSLTGLPEKFNLEIHNTINPTENKALDGLYKSGSIFCTQNEPEGFRRITYYMDRPDIMAKFTTKIIADKTLYPTLLSNGNPIDSGDLEDGKHFVTWEDPFLKPAYLYALVAGDLGEVKDTFKTMTGRTIDCRIFCDKGNEDKCGHAMESLKNSMKWDEETYGLEYDLDIYMIVAVDSFNMGAMENKGLNIFNSAYVLAKPETATDNDFFGVEGVVGHEYFHNWTGNRITCRDWFQLTLKEGLTVFRDQEFSADMNQRTVKRIEDVTGLRAAQFPEDSGPTSHPIKPKSYIEMNNFYTSTVYEKGSEVIRMIHTFLGKEGFRKGMDKYFELFDGQAVTTEDFIHAMSIANDNYDFSQFTNWYDQAGTPVLDIKTRYDEVKKEYSVTVTQSCPDTPGQTNKLPYHMPLVLGLIDQAGNDMELKLTNNPDQKDLSRGLIHLRNITETFVFSEVNQKPIPSMNRGFSAPVNLKMEQSFVELAHRLAYDSDEFNRFESGQELMTKSILDLYNKEESEWSLDPVFMAAFAKLLNDDALDDAYKAMAISLPGASILHQAVSPIDFDKMHKAIEFCEKSLGTSFADAFLKVFNESSAKLEGDKNSVRFSGTRDLKSVTLTYLMATGLSHATDLCVKTFQNAPNMSEEISSLSLLCEYSPVEAKACVNDFYTKWKKETLVMQKWLRVQANVTSDKTFERVQELEKSDIYDKNVPNLFRSLWGSFGKNYTQLHHKTGRGYKLLADKVIELDKINPQIASRIVSLFKDYKKVTPANKVLMKVEIDRILTTDGLSKNTFEIIGKIALDE